MNAKKWKLHKEFAAVFFFFSLRGLSPAIRSNNHTSFSSFMTWAIARMIGFPLRKALRPPYETACTALGETKN